MQHLDSEWSSLYAKSFDQGVWAIVFLQLPGSEPKPAGILLWDPSANELHAATKNLHPEESDDDLALFWSEFPTFVRDLNEDLGGLEALKMLESTSSHVFQIGSPSRVSIGQADQVLQELFHAHIAEASFRAKYTDHDLEQAAMKLPALPSVFIQIINALNDPLSNSTQIERAISQDPVLSAHLVRLANSAALPFRDPVRSVQAAIQRLGFDITRLQVLALTMRKMYSSALLKRVWNHSISVAQICRHLAKKAKLPADEAALVALVHDIGLIVLFGLGTGFEIEYEEMQKGGLPGLAVEKRLCTVAHPEAGARLLAKWNFPPDLCDAVLHHHRPSESNSPLASLLYVAESGMEANEDVYEIDEHDRAMWRLGLNQTNRNLLSTDLDFDLQVLRAVA